MSDSLEPPDEQVMDRVRSGDAVSLEVLYGRHSEGLAAFLHRVGAPGSEVEDLVQDAFLAVLRSRHTYRSGSAFRPWLYGVAINLWRRRVYRGSLHDRAVEVVREGAQGARRSGNEAAERLGELLKDLPPEQKEALILSRYEGLSYAEIGQIQGTSETAVKQKIYRAMCRLREAMELEKAKAR